MYHWLLLCSVCRALDGILRCLDHQVGRQLTSTNPQQGKSVQEVLRSVGRGPEEVCGGTVVSILQWCEA